MMKRESLRASGRDLAERGIVKELQMRMRRYVWHAGRVLVYTDEGTGVIGKQECVETDSGTDR